MFTLLTHTHKKQLLKQYRMRLFSVVALLLGAMFIISGVLLIPSYITLRLEKDRLAKEDQMLSKQISDQNAKGFVQTLSEIKTMSSLAVVENTKVYEALLLVSASRPYGITFSSVGYVHGVGAPSLLTISGSAANRSNLIAFTEKLKKEKIFDSVDLPVGNLAKETDAKFTINMTGKF